jgi:hypothetical protein
MDLRKEISQEHSKAQAHKIADYVGSNAKRFEALIEVYLAGPYRVTQRAAWPLSLCVESHPSLIGPHLKKVLDYLKKPGIHDAVKRNTMRLLQFVTIPRRNHDQVVNLCFDYLLRKQEPVAVKAFAMTVLSKIVEDKPELQRELKIILEDQLPFASPAFRVRAVKIIRELS